MNESDCNECVCCVCVCLGADSRPGPLTGRDGLPRHTIPPLSKVAKVGQPRKVISHHIGNALSMANHEPERLQGEIPPGQPTVMVLHAVNPGECTMICLEVKLPP